VLGHALGDVAGDGPRHFAAGDSPDGVVRRAAEPVRREPPVDADILQAASNAFPIPDELWCRLPPPLLSAWRWVRRSRSRHSPSHEPGHLVNQPEAGYRIMKARGWLLARHGQVHTDARRLRSNLRWCSDAFEIRCSNDERVQVAPEPPATTSARSKSSSVTRTSHHDEGHPRPESRRRWRSQPSIADQPATSRHTSHGPGRGPYRIIQRGLPRKPARSRWSGHARRPGDCCGQGLSNCGEYELGRRGEW